MSGGGTSIPSIAEGGFGVGGGLATGRIPACDANNNLRCARDKFFFYDRQELKFASESLHVFTHR